MVRSGARNYWLPRAAQKWNVSAETLTAADGKVSNSAGRSFTYSELAAGNQLLHVIPAEVAVTPAASWSVAGDGGSESRWPRFCYRASPVHAGPEFAGNAVRQNSAAAIVPCNARVS